MQMNWLQKRTRESRGKCFSREGQGGGEAMGSRCGWEGLVGGNTCHTQRKLSVRFGYGKVKSKQALYRKPKTKKENLFILWGER